MDHSQRANNLKAMHKVLHLIIEAVYTNRTNKMTRIRRKKRIDNRERGVESKDSGFSFWCDQYDISPFTFNITFSHLADAFIQATYKWGQWKQSNQQKSNDMQVL